MKYSHIMLTDKGLLALNAPEKPSRYLRVDDEYQQFLQQAINEGCYFKDNFHSFVWYPNEKNKPYPIPDGYEVRVEKGWKWIDKEYGRKEDVEYSILVLKQVETTLTGNTKMVEVCLKCGATETPYHSIHCSSLKQQSIEEAADQYSYEFDTRYQPIAKQDFIAGAKSQITEMILLKAFEAGMMFVGEDKGSFKEWYEQFKQEKL